MGIFSGEERKAAARERLASGFWDRPPICRECVGAGKNGGCELCGLPPSCGGIVIPRGDACPEATADTMAQPPAFLLKREARYRSLLARIQTYEREAPMWERFEYWRGHRARLQRLMRRGA